MWLSTWMLENVLHIGLIICAWFSLICVPEFDFLVLNVWCVKWYITNMFMSKLYIKQYKPPWKIHQNTLCKVYLRSPYSISSGSRTQEPNKIWFYYDISLISCFFSPFIYKILVGMHIKLLLSSFTRVQLVLRQNFITRIQQVLWPLYAFH